MKTFKVELMAWTLGLVGGVAVVCTVVPASAKGPRPVPETELARCIDATRLRLADLAAANEGALSQELAARAGADVLLGAALGVRAGGDGGTELVFAFNQAPRVGQTGTFGTLTVTVTTVYRQHAIAKVSDTLEQARTQLSRGRGLRLVGEGAGENETPSAWTLPAAHAGGMAMPRAVVDAAVNEMNAKGGLPWIAWDDDAGRPARSKRVKVAVSDSEQGGWLPLKNADSAMHPLWVVGLDLEKNGTPYLFIAINDGPVSDTTEIWRAEKGKWKKLATASGSIAGASRDVDGRIMLRFDDYLDASVWAFDPTTRKVTMVCSIDDSSETTGGDGNSTWGSLVAQEGARKLTESGAGTVPFRSFVGAEEADAQLARGTTLWRLRISGDQTYVARVQSDPKRLTKDLRPALGRILTTGWVPSKEIGAR